MTLLYIGTSIIILFSCTAKSSLDMINWSTANVRLVNTVEVAQGMVRVTYAADPAFKNSNAIFLRVRVTGQ